MIANKTSCLLVRDVAAPLRQPGRLLGLHYFSPAEVSPIVELVSTQATRADVMDRARAFLAATGKSPLPCKDSPGFALNRFFCPPLQRGGALPGRGLGYHRAGSTESPARRSASAPARSG